MDRKPTEYVCGFMFQHDAPDVLLIRKNKPEWQKGKLNGIGGKIEEGEWPAEAMFREFFEETGHPALGWAHRVTLTGDTWRVYFFAATGDTYIARQTTDERIERHNRLKLPKDVIPNLRWLIPLCFDASIDGPVEINELYPVKA